MASDCWIVGGLLSTAMLGMSVAGVKSSRAFRLERLEDARDGHTDEGNGEEGGTMWSAIGTFFMWFFRGSVPQKADFESLGDQWAGFNKVMAARFDEVAKEAREDRATARKELAEHKAEAAKEKLEIQTDLVRCQARDLASQKRVNKLESEIESMKENQEKLEAVMQAEIDALRKRLDDHDSGETKAVAGPTP